ncbi:MAG TPA: hypothetical protein VHD87_14965 [Acidimicrobiales bacterium]|nr:hypothetical protein [Acidimicrobiales bacterium]
MSSTKDAEWVPSEPDPVWVETSGVSPLILGIMFAVVLVAIGAVVIANWN